MLILENGFEPVWFLLLAIADCMLFIYVHYLIDRYFNRVDIHKNSKPKEVTPIDTESREYRLCRFIWTHAILFSKEATQSPSPKCTAYLWTAFFYAVTKEIRNQEIVNHIYAQFRNSALPLVKDRQDPAKIVDDMQSHYRKLREVLNSTGIDPRTEDGLRALWGLTSAFAFPNTELPVNTFFGFKYSTMVIVKHALSLYQLMPKSETVYSTETANGMVVRVPESKLEAWQAAQDEIRSNPDVAKLTPQEEELKRKILDHIYGRNRNGGDT